MEAVQPDEPQHPEANQQDKCDAPDGVQSQQLDNGTKGATQQRQDNKKDISKETEPLHEDHDWELVQAILPDPVELIPSQTLFTQMDVFLINQLDKCSFYKSVYQTQSNKELAARFDALLANTQKDLDLLRRCRDSNKTVPKFKIESIEVTCTPTNTDVQDKELQLVIHTRDLPVAENALVYVIGEFEFSLAGKGESLTQTAGRWVHGATIDPRKIICCSASDTRQLDVIYSTKDKPFYELEDSSNSTAYGRALKFFVERGRSRTLKRKFKPVKLTFYEKTSFFRFDKRLGTTTVRIDSINDQATITEKAPIMIDRKTKAATAEMMVRVREPLVEKGPQTYVEQILVFE